MENLSNFALQIADCSVRKIQSLNKEIADIEQFRSVVKDELKEFFFGESYKDERECIQNKTLSDKYIKASIVSSIILKTNYKEGI